MPQNDNAELQEMNVSTDTAQSPTKNIMLVDDHPIVRQGMAILINQEPDLRVSSEASTAAEALEKLKVHTPDAIIIDVSLQSSSGIDLTKSVKELYPNLPVLILSMHDETLYAERALKAGARGYVMKQEAAETVIHAIRTILAGNIHLSNALSAKVLRDMVDGVKPREAGPYGVERLSDRELEVFELIGRGHTTRGIAESLNLSIKTIETHRAHIKQKLKLKNATELVHRAFHWIETSVSG
jgi:DNA-binding NarL/FixJ family response regulator